MYGRSLLNNKQQQNENGFDDNPPPAFSWNNNSNNNMDYENQAPHDNSNMNNSGNQNFPQYSIPGILQFIQAEWSRFELERAQWKVEKAELTAQVAFLQGEQKGQQNLRRDLIRRIKMLEFALKQERQRYYQLKTGENLDLGDNGGSQGNSEASSGSGSDSDGKNEDELENGELKKVKTVVENGENVKEVDQPKTEGKTDEKADKKSGKKSDKKLKTKKSKKRIGEEKITEKLKENGLEIENTDHNSSSDDENKNPNQFYWKHGRQLLRQYLQEVGYTDTILNVRAKRLRTLLVGNENPAMGITGQVPQNLPNSMSNSHYNQNNTNMHKGEEVMGDASGDFNHMENMQTMKKRKSSNPEDQGDWGDQVDRSKMNQKIADFKDEQKNHKVPEFNQDKILEQLKNPLNGLPDADLESNEYQNDGMNGNMNGGHGMNGTNNRMNGNDIENNNTGNSQEWWNNSNLNQNTNNVVSNSNWSHQVESNNQSGNSNSGELSKIRVDHDIDGISSMSTTNSMLGMGGPSNKLFDQVINTITQNQENNNIGTDGWIAKQNQRDVGNANAIAAANNQNFGNATNNNANMKSESWTQFIPKFALRGHYETIRDFAFHPQENVVLSASDDGTLKLWNLIQAADQMSSSSNRKVADCDPVYSFRMHKSPVLSCAFTHGGFNNAVSNSISTCSFSGTADGQMFCYKTPSINTDLVGEFTPKDTIFCELVGHDDAVWSLEWNDTQNMLASASADGSIQLWKPEMVSSFHERGGLDNGEFDVESEEFGISDRFEKDGVEDDDVYKGLLAKNANQEDMEEKHNGKDKEEQMREIKDEQEKWMRWPTLKSVLNIAESGVGMSGEVYITPNRVAWLNSTTLVASFTDGTIRLYDVQTGKEIQTLNSLTHIEEGSQSAARDLINSISVCQQMNYVAAAYEDHYARIFDVNSNKLVSSIVAHQDSATAISVDSNGHHFSTGSASGTIRIWSLENKQCFQELSQAHYQRLDESVCCVKFHPQRSRILGSSGVDAIVKMYHC